MAVYRRTSRRRPVLLLLVLTSLTLITIDTREGDTGVVASVRSTARDVMAPVQRAVDDTLTPVGDWWDGVVRAGEIKQDNARLRRRLAQVEGRTSQDRVALKEYATLKKEAKLTFLPGLNGVVSEVVVKSPGNFESTVGIDKGKDDGILNDMPVVSGAGLVGRVTKASRRQAAVQLITDPDSGVAVRLERTGALGIAQGESGSKQLRLQFVDPAVTVRRGELVSTTRIEGGTYPAGIPVARVASVRKSPGALEQRISLQPLADLDRLSFVKVLLWPSGGGG